MALTLGQLADEQPVATVPFGTRQAKGFDTRRRENSLTFIPFALRPRSRGPNLRSGMHGTAPDRTSVGEKFARSEGCGGRDSRVRWAARDVRADPPRQGLSPPG